MRNKIIDRIKQLEHKVNMMKKRREQIIHEAMTARRRVHDDELLRLEVKIEEDEKFIRFLKSLLHKEE